jgi:hypothetical protein
MPPTGRAHYTHVRPFRPPRNLPPGLCPGHQPWVSYHIRFRKTQKKGLTMDQHALRALLVPALLEGIRIKLNNVTVRCCGDAGHRTAGPRNKAHEERYATPVDIRQSTDRRSV